MRRSATLAAAPILAALLLGPAAGVGRAQAPPQPPAAAQPPPDDPVVARVDGQPIRLSDVAEAARGLPEELRAAPPQIIYPLILDQLISQQALVNAARRQGIDRDPQVAARVRQAEERELQQALIQRELRGSLTEEALRRRYDQTVANRPAEEEVRVRQILVATETAAREVLAELRRPGADFAEVARRRSTGPGAQEGGDLGFFKKGDMVPEFAEAAFALQPGQISDPVRSPFGWHVIRLEERRSAPPPAYEEVRESLRQQLVEQEVTAFVERVRNGAQIERFNLDGTPQRPASGGGGGSLLDNAAPPPPSSPQPQRR